MSSHSASGEKAFALLVLAAFWTQGVAAQSPTTPCAMYDTARVAHRLEYLQDLVSSHDTDRVQMRQALGLPFGAAAMVRFVVDTTLCRRSIAALNWGRDGALVREVWVYRLPEGYAVDSPELDVPGMDRDLYFLDRHFRYRAIVNGF